MEVAIKLQDGVGAKIRKHGMNLGCHMITWKPQMITFKSETEGKKFLSSIQFKKYMVVCEGKEIEQAEEDALEKQIAEEEAAKKLKAEKDAELEAEAKKKAEEEEATAAAKAESQGE